ncbi:MAG: hypothetical protein V3V09_09860, partial [Arenicellales bacterium]
LLKTENQIRLANNETTYDNIEQLREEQEKARNESTYTKDAPFRTDAFMLETSQILNDVLHLNQAQFAEANAKLGTPTPMN